MNAITVHHNTRLDGVEVFFPADPGPMVRTRLKDLGFRWSHRSRCWYKRYTAAAWAQAHQFAGLAPTPPPEQQTPEGAYVQAQEEAYFDNFCQSNPDHEI